MPTKPEGVYQDSRGGWYFKVTLGTDPLTGGGSRSPGGALPPHAEAGGRDGRCSAARSTRGQLRPAPGC